MSTISPPNHLTVFVIFHVKPNQIEAWKEAHRPVWSHLAAEPKCIYFDVFQDTRIAGRFRLIEVWNATRDWFENVQLKKEYYDTLWARSKPTWEKEIEIEYFERLGEGMSWKEEFLKP